jgi:ABC-type dipeptide/oligopeptide/nickel transport system permease component
MFRFALRSLVLVPPVLLLVHFLGFAFAFFVGPRQLSRQPLYFSEVNPGPFLPSYMRHLGDLLRFDLGPLPGSRAEMPVLAVLGQATLASAGLLALALLLSIIVGLLLGFAAVRDRPPRVAPWLVSTATIGLATPTFFFGTLAVTLVIVILIVVPGRFVLLPLEGYGWDTHLVLPTLTLMLRPTAQIAQVTASSVVTELSKQYVVAARSFGYSERRIASRHVLRNALGPIIATIGGSLRLLVGELIIVENLFYWPGLGSLLAQTLIPPLVSVGEPAALFLNPPVIAITMVEVAALFLFANLIASLLNQFADPRVRV